MFGGGWIVVPRLTRLKTVYEFAGRVAEQESNQRGVAMPTGQDRTKEQLYRQAKSLGIKGRSKMSKGQLKAALARKGH
jgi:hypothetical protein